MSNHGYVTSKRWFKADQIEEDLKEIVSRRFGFIPIKRDDNGFAIGFGYPYEVEMWVENVHKLEFRNPMPQWCWWIQTVIQNELAIKYNGIISDEGVSEKWKGKANKYPTYDDWLDVAGGMNLPKPLKWIIKTIEKNVDISKEIKATFGKRK